jgi:hypothetical protein
MNRAKGDRIGATRGKLALIGVLAAAFVGVLASNFRGSGEALALATPVTATGAGVPAGIPAAASGPSPFGEFAADGDWAQVSLDKLIDFDPLAAPPWMATGETAAVDATAAASAEQSLEEVQQAHNAIIFITGGQRVARIGTQDYHVGDMVGRFQITDISSAGLVLSEPVGDARDR